MPGQPGRTLVSLPVHQGRTLACVVQVVAELDEPDDYTWALIRQVSDQLSSVAERERAADQLAEARDQAMEASRHKSEFLATMSHEIRTPMNGVIGLTDLLLRTRLDARQQRLAEGLRGAGLTLLSLINDILDLSKIESGKLELEAIEFDVRDVLDETAMILAGPAVDKGLELVVGCAPEVPRLVRGDPVRLGQVLTNLGSNAVKFTEAGEVVIDVQVVTDGEDDDETVVLRTEVRDTGIGIAEGVDGLFDAFTQADRSTTRQHGGTGLGLAISKQLVEGMGGEIGVRSRPGAGSVFWFTARLGAIPADADLSHLDQPLARRRVLVVADHPSTASFLVRQLTAWHLQVDQVGAADAMSALAGAVADGAAYDVALVDLASSGRTGPDLGRQVRADPALVGTDLVLLAGDGAIGDDDLRAAGYRTRVPKPVRTSELSRRAAAAGARRRRPGRASSRGAARTRSAGPGRRGQRRQPAGRRRPAREPRLHRLRRRQRRRGRRGAHARPRVRRRAHGLPDAAHGRLRGHPRHPRPGAGRAGADRRDDRVRAARRARPVPRGRHGRLPDQAGRPRPARGHGRPLRRRPALDHR